MRLCDVRLPIGATVPSGAAGSRPPLWRGSLAALWFLGCHAAPVALWLAAGSYGGSVWVAWWWLGDVQGHEDAAAAPAAARGSG